jgi:iron-sulfur cluster repair protein YtfE (RIC family)
MDPYQILKKDHETVSQLFKKIEAASGRVKLIRFRKLKSELDLHAHIEETIFYPALQNAEESRDITLEAFEEHKVVKELLAELAAATKLSDEWTAKLSVLKENVEHHVDEEEGELFSKAKDVLTDEQAERLGDEMAAEKTKQGGTVPEELKKPGLIKKVVNALFGAHGEATRATKSSQTRRPAKARPAELKAATTARKTASKAKTGAGKKAAQSKAAKAPASKAKAKIARKGSATAGKAAATSRKASAKKAAATRARAA